MKRTQMEKIRLAVKVLSELSDEEWEELCAIYDHAKSKQRVKISVKLDGEQLANITKTIHMLGIRVGTKGYEYVRAAVIYFMDAENICNIVMSTEVYPMIAKEYGAAEKSVEKAIRNALNNAFKDGDKELIEKIFGRAVTLGNGEAIAAIAEYLQMNY